MSEKVICGQCPAIYWPEEILACLEDEAVTTLAALRRNGAATSGASRSSDFIRVAFGLRPKEPVQDGPNVDRLKDLRAYDFECPKGHRVDGNPGTPFGIAVLGGSGASKSHWLPAIVREMDHMSALRKLGVRLSDALYPNPQLPQSVTEVYERCRQLPATPRGEMLGPFGCKLMIGGKIGDRDAQKYAMQLYDIAGEDLAAIASIAEKAQFIAFSRGLIVLIDPVEFLPTQFDAGPVGERLRLDAGRGIRSGIRAITETLTEIWAVSSPRDLEIPICFVLAKADAIDWTGEFDWSGQTDAVVAAGAGDGDTRAALLASSEETRDAFDRLGGELVIDEVEESFNPEFVRWSAASATSTMPTLGQGPADRDWMDEPQPRGVALSVLQILDAAGEIPQPLVPSAT
jgi:hypothetical protein